MLNFPEESPLQLDVDTEDHKETIVLCDDNSLVLKTTSLILKSFLGAINDYDLKKFKNGKLVLDFIRTNNQTSLIISDLDMPETSGIELVKKLRGEIKDQVTPFVLISGDTSHAVQIEKLIEEGYIDAFVEKPFSRESLRQGIEKAIAMRLEKTQDSESK